jgi:protein-disulfide isomerase
MNAIWRFIIGCSIVGVASASQTFGQQSPSSSSSVAATVGTEQISEAELERVAARRLIAIQAQEYAMRRAVLDELVEDRLLNAEAKRRGMTREALERAEITSKAQPPSQSEVDSVYDSAKDRIPKGQEAEARKRLVSMLTERRLDARRATYIKELTSRSPVKVMLPAPRTEIEPGQAPSRGPANAPITIIEFSDYQCPFCGKAYNTLKQVMAKYPSQVRLVYVDYPLPIHRDAPKAAEAAHCAADQGQFWQMHDLMFEQAGDLTTPALLNHARTLKLNDAAFSQCLSSGKHVATWQKGAAKAQDYGVNATPAFFVNGRFVNGAVPLEQFTEIVDEELLQVSRARGAGARPGASR